MHTLLYSSPDAKQGRQKTMETILLLLPQATNDPKLTHKSVIPSTRASIELHRRKMKGNLQQMRSRASTHRLVV